VWYNTIMTTKQKKPRNPVAKDLRTPKYRMRVVKSKVVYDRKQQRNVIEIESKLES
jgi:hypothetical protein